MATNFAGSLEPFDPKTTTWPIWEKRFNSYCRLSKITEEEAKIDLLSILLGGETFKLLCDLISPDGVETKTTAELLEVLNVHFTPQKIVISERYRFYKRAQMGEETTAQYIAVLRNLAKDCEFGEYLTQALRDCLVLGLRSEPARRRLLGEKNLDLNRAIELATSMEMADRDSTELSRPQNGNGDVHQFDRRRPPQVKTSASAKCYRCNGTTHSPDDCWFKDAECRKCHKVGHVDRACKSGQKGNGSQPAKKRPVKKFNKSAKSHHIDEEEVDGDMGHLEINCTDLPKKFLVNVDVNSNSLPMEVDTGAAVTVINDATWK